MGEIKESIYGIWSIHLTQVLLGEIKPKMYHFPKGVKTVVHPNIVSIFEPHTHYLFFCYFSYYRSLKDFSRIRVKINNR